MVKVVCELIGFDVCVPLFPDQLSPLVPMTVQESVLVELQVTLVASPFCTKAGLAVMVVVGGGGGTHAPLSH